MTSSKLGVEAQGRSLGGSGMGKKLYEMTELNHCALSDE